MGLQVINSIQFRYPVKSLFHANKILNRNNEGKMSLRHQVLNQKTKGNKKMKIFQKEPFLNTKLLQKEMHK